MLISALLAIDQATGLKYFLKWSSFIAVFYIVYLNVSSINEIRRILLISLWMAAVVSIMGIVVYVFAHDKVEQVIQFFLHHHRIASIMEPDTLIYKLTKDRSELNWFCLRPDGQMQLRAFGTFECVLCFSSYLGLVMAFASYIFIHVSSVKQKIVNGCAILLLFIVLILTYSRSAYLAMIIVTFMNVVMVTIKRQARWEIIKIIAAGCILLAVLTVLITPVHEEILSRVTATSDAARVRNFYWRQGLAIIKARPAMGVGLANYGEGINKYVNLSGWAKRSSHNQYIQLGAEIGLIGLSIYMAIGIYSLYYSLKLFQISKDFSISLLSMGFLGMWVWIGFQSMFYEPIGDAKFGMMFWLMVGLNASLYRIYKNENKIVSGLNSNTR
jgi:hypothetical protein